MANDKIEGLMAAQAQMKSEAVQAQIIWLDLPNFSNDNKFTHNIDDFHDQISQASHLIRLLT